MTFDNVTVERGTIDTITEIWITHLKYGTIFHINDEEYIKWLGVAEVQRRATNMELLYQNYDFEEGLYEAKKPMLGRRSFSYPQFRP